jgi:hypothetical protein
LDSPDSLLVENVEGGYWLPPQQRERLKKRGLGEPAYNWNQEMFANILLQMIYTVIRPPDYDDVSLSVVLAGTVDLDAMFFMIEHKHTLLTRGVVRDCWQIGIAWQVGEFENPDNPDYPIPQILGIICMTNIDAESEGVYGSDNDIWTVTFEDARGVLFENVGVDEDGQPIFSYPWEGRLSFTVTITRTNVEP